MRFHFFFDFLISSLNLWTVFLELRNFCFSSLPFLCQLLARAFIRVSVLGALKKSSNAHYWEQQMFSPNFTPSNHLWNILLVTNQNSEQREEKYSKSRIQKFLFGKPLSQTISLTILKIRSLQMCRTFCMPCINNPQNIAGDIKWNPRFVCLFFYSPFCYF